LTYESSILFFLWIPRLPRSTLFPYTTLFRSSAMAKYFLHVKVFSRGKGSRVTRAAAYRAGERIRDERTSEVYNYSDRHDVLHKEDRKSTRLNSSHVASSYAVFCLKKNK